MNFLLLFLSFLLPSLYRSPFISPYKATPLKISRPYINTPNSTFTLTFSISEIAIPPSAFLLLSFPDASIFISNDAGNIFDCTLKDFSETVGFHFNPMNDLSSVSSSSSASSGNNYVGSCGRVTDDTKAYFFNLNASLSPEPKMYQATFRLSGQFKLSGNSYIKIGFMSEIYWGSYEYAANWFFSMFRIKENPPTFSYAQASLQRNPFTKEYYVVMNNALKSSLMTYNQAVLNPTDINVVSFNDMINNGLITGDSPLDSDIYPVGIEKFPGFSGILSLDFSIDYDIDSFQLFEIQFPNSWILSNSQCISVDFTAVINGVSVTSKAIGHTKCDLKDNTFQFYNILSIKKGKYIRMNITNVRNPVIVTQGYISLSIINSNKGIIIQRNQQISGLSTISNGLSINVIPSTFAVGTKMNELFYNKQQGIKLSLTQLYFDIKDEVKLEFSLPTFTLTYGFVAGSCVVMNKYNATTPKTGKNVECTIDGTNQKLTLSNIAEIRKDKPIEIYYQNKNEASGTQLAITLKVFGLDPTTTPKALSSTPYLTSSLTPLSLLAQTLPITSANYLTWSSDPSTLDAPTPIETTVMNTLYASNYLAFTFTLPIGNSVSAGDSLVLLMNQYVNLPDNPSCTIPELPTFHILCVFANITENMMSMTITFQTGSLPTLFTNTAFTLRVMGCYYSYLVFNSFYYNFEYYLIYNFTSAKRYLIGLVRGNIDPTLQPTTPYSQARVIGQACSSLVSKSLVRMQLSSSEQFYSLLNSHSLIKLKIRLFMQNLNNDKSDYDPYPCIPPSNASGAACTFRKGLAPASTNYLNWDYVEIAEIPVESYSNHIDIQVIPGTLAPNYYFAYYYIEAPYSSKSSFETLYSVYSITYACPDESLITTIPDLSFNWAASYLLNGALFARTSNQLVISVSIESLDFPLFRGSDSSELGFFLIYLPWVINDQGDLDCSLQYRTDVNLMVNVLLDDLRNSIMIFSFGTYIDGVTFSDNIICKNAWTPMSRSQEQYTSFITKRGGEILSKKVVAQTQSVFEPG